MTDKDKTGRITKIIKRLSDEEKKDMTHVKACKIVACEPSVMMLAKIVDEHPEINFEDTKKIVQEINKRLFKIDKYKAPSVMVGTALYLVNKELNQEKAAELANTTKTSMRITMNLVKLDRKDKWRHARKLAIEKYRKWDEEYIKRYQ